MTAADHFVVRGGTIVDPGAADPGSSGPGRGDVVIAAGRVVSIGGTSGEPERAVLDATGCLVAPGFVDVQVNGAVGVDMTSEPHRVSELAAALVRFGVTAFCPTVITAESDVVLRAIRAVREHRAPTGHRPDGAARVIGLHLEGPYLAPTRSGAHPAEQVRAPSVDEVSGWVDAAGGPSNAADVIAMVTLAPELPGALEVVDLLVGLGVTVCAGHTEATAAQLATAEARGVRGVTHLFNAMSQLGHREPGAVGATLASDRLIAGLIVDGVHVDPAVIDIAWRLLGPDRVALVSDSVAALGLGDGTHLLGEVPVVVAGGMVTTTSGTLAGSVLSIDRAVRNLVAFTGCSVEDACRAASTTPAALLGAGELGRIEPGRPADLVLLDESLDVVATVVGGRVVFDPQRRLTEDSTWR